MGELIRASMVNSGMMRKDDAVSIYYKPPQWNPYPTRLMSFVPPNRFWYRDRNKVIQQRRNDGLTLKAIGDEFSLGKERVRQILLRNKRNEIT